MASLATERGPVNMAVGGLLVLEAGPGVDYAAVVQRLEQRLHLIPRYRQRLEEAPLGLANPVWVDDHAFEAEWHVHSASLPDPGGDAELDAYVGRAMSRRLDRSGRCGSCMSSTGSPTGARPSWPRCTTRWSTGWRRSTWGR